MAALRFGDFPPVRQLLKARQTTLILDEEYGERTKTIRVAPTSLMMVRRCARCERHCPPKARSIGCHHTPRRAAEGRFDPPATPSRNDCIFAQPTAEVDVER